MIPGQNAAACTIAVSSKAPANTPGNAQRRKSRGTEGSTVISCRRRVGGPDVARLLVMPDHLVDDEAQEFLAELRVELRVRGQSAQSLDLPFLAAGIRRGQP